MKDAPPESGEPAPAEDAAKPADEPKEPSSPSKKPSDEKPSDEKPEKPADEATPEEKPAAEQPSEEAPQSSYRGAGQKFRLVSATQQETADQSPQNPKLPPRSQQPTSRLRRRRNPHRLTSRPPNHRPPKSRRKSPPKRKTNRPQKNPRKKNRPKRSPTTSCPGRRCLPTRHSSSRWRRSRIRFARTLARQKAIERITEQFDALSAKMRTYAADYDRYTVEKGSDPSVRPPALLDFAELAQGKDVQPFELKSVSPEQVAKEDIGKSFRSMQSLRGAQAVPFVNFAYSDTMPEFRPEMTQDNDNNAYLFWRTQLEPPYVPPLDQIRDNVVRAWKMIKARELARKRGEEYAEQVRTLHKTLTELFGSQETLKVTETQPFSWLTFGNVPAQPGARPRLSEVEGVDLPGPAFMKTVFGLSADGVGVTLNEPQDTAYVVRLVDFEPSLDELRDAFAREQPSRYLAAAFDDQRQIYETWIKDLNAEADVHWIRQADARRAAEDEEL